MFKDERMHSRTYFQQVAEIAQQIDCDAIEEMAQALAAVRERGGRLFFLGVGGSAANCSHAVNDFRKLAGIECYAPTDNAAELTARTNDEGWDTIFSAWLEVSRLNDRDALFVLSVGGGDAENNVSPCIVKALQLGLERQSTIFGIVGRAEGYTHQVGHHVLLVPAVEKSLVTPHSEAFQAVVWHSLVSNPALQTRSTKWESIQPAVAQTS